MLYLFYGPDTYRSARKIREVVAAYHKKNPTGVNFLAVDFSSSVQATRQLMDLAPASQSLFPERKCVVVRYGSGSPEFLEWLNRELVKGSHARNDFFLILHEEALPEAHPLVGISQRFGKRQHFPKLQGPSLRRFVQEEARKRSLNFTAEGFSLFLARVGEDPWRIEQELEKLLLAGFRFAEVATATQAGVGRSVPIGLQEVRTHVAEAALEEGSLFSLADAAALRHAASAAEAFLAHWQRGTSEAEMLAVLLWRFRSLLLVSGDTPRENATRAAQPLRMHPFALKKAREALAHWSQEEVVCCYHELFALEYGEKQNALRLSSAFVRFLSDTGAGMKKTTLSRTALLLFQEARQA